MTGLRRAFQALRRGLIALGLLLGTINMAILLSIVYLTFIPWIRLGYWISGKDPLGRKLFAKKASTWVALDGAARAPTAEDLEHLF